MPGAAGASTGFPDLLILLVRLQHSLNWLDSNNKIIDKVVEIGLTPGGDAILEMPAGIQ
jgi:hypothetical protein